MIIEEVMPGFVHIFGLGTEPDEGHAAPQYQLNYNLAGKTYVRVFDERGLSKFLRSDLGIVPQAVEKALEELRREGRTTITDVEINEYEAPALGLEQLPSDY